MTRSVQLQDVAKTRNEGIITLDTRLIVASMKFSSWQLEMSGLILRVEPIEYTDEQRQEWPIRYKVTRITGGSERSEQEMGFNALFDSGGIPLRDALLPLISSFDFRQLYHRVGRTTIVVSPQEEVKA